MWNYTLIDFRNIQVSNAVCDSWILSINLLSFKKHGGERFRKKSDISNKAKWIGISLFSQPIR